VTARNREGVANGRTHAVVNSADRPVAVTVATRTIVVFVLVVLSAFLVLALVYEARSVLVQLVVAVVLAMAVEPAVQSLERRGLRRGAAVGISFGIVAVALAAFAYLLVAPSSTRLDGSFTTRRAWCSN
jgi:predicted PurR-regulated permease PerM